MENTIGQKLLLLPNKEKLPVEFRENAVSFNLAQLYFYQKNMTRLFNFFKLLKFEDFTYNLVSKSMLIATYYETEEMEPLFSLFESFRVYLNRHKSNS